MVFGGHRELWFGGCATVGRSAHAHSFADTKSSTSFNDRQAAVRVLVA
jgi:hypothetical protein